MFARFFSMLRFCFILLIIICRVSAQLSGTVLHWNKSPLSGCVVTLQELDNQSITNRGSFVLDFNTGTVRPDIESQQKPNLHSKGNEVHFYLPEKSKIFLTVAEVSGKSIGNIEREYPSGYHFLNLTHFPFMKGRTGIFFYKFKLREINEEHVFFLDNRSHGEKFDFAAKVSHSHYDSGHVPKTLGIIVDTLLITCQNLPQKKIEVTDYTQDLGHIIMPKPPNVVIIMADDLGWMDVGYKNGDYLTPHVNQLKKEGLFFSRAYIATPTCSPSRATLLTGRHPARYKMPRHIPDNVNNEEFHILTSDPAKFPSRNWLPLEETTYAEGLKPFGYYNVYVGKWHLGKEPYFPIKQGFDEELGVTWHGHPSSYYAPYYNSPSSSESSAAKYLTDYLTDEAVGFLEGYDRENPFTLTLSYHAVHSPIEPRTDLLELHQQRGLGGWKAPYAAMISAVDESLGRLRTALEDAGLQDSTIIIWLSDQGGDKPNTPLRGGKRGGTAFYEGGIRVPFIVYWPGITPKGDSSEVHIWSTDIFPTLLDIAGSREINSDSLDGVSIKSMLVNPSSKLVRENLYFWRSYEDQYASILSQNLKLIAYRSGSYELYDIEEDVGEQNNLATSKPQAVKNMATLLELWEKKMGVKNN